MSPRVVWCVIASIHSTERSQNPQREDFPEELFDSISWDIAFLLSTNGKHFTSSKIWISVALTGCSSRGKKKHAVQLLAFSESPSVDTHEIKMEWDICLPCRPCPLFSLWNHASDLRVRNMNNASVVFCCVSVAQCRKIFFSLTVLSGKDYMKGKQNKKKYSGIFC